MDLGKVKEISISGSTTIIDEEDFPMVSRLKWRALKRGKRVYFQSGRHPDNTILLHRYLMNCPGNRVVDHINGNTLDNRKSNLRICTRQENNINVTKRRSNKTGFKGVSKRTDCNRYKSQIAVNKKVYNLGTFETPEEAYLAYCEASKKYHGKYGRID